MTHWIVSWWHNHSEALQPIMAPVASLPIFALASVVGNALGSDTKQILFFAGFVFVVERVLAKRLDNHLKVVDTQVERMRMTAESLDSQHAKDSGLEQRLDKRYTDLEARVGELEKWRVRNPMGGA